MMAAWKKRLVTSLPFCMAQTRANNYINFATYLTHPATTMPSPSRMDERKRRSRSRDRGSERVYRDRSRDKYRDRDRERRRERDGERAHRSNRHDGPDGRHGYKDRDRERDRDENRERRRKRGDDYEGSERGHDDKVKRKKSEVLDDFSPPPPPPGLPPPPPPRSLPDSPPPPVRYIYIVFIIQSTTCWHNPQHLGVILLPMRPTSHLWMSHTTLMNRKKMTLKHDLFLFPNLLLAWQPKT